MKFLFIALALQVPLVAPQPRTDVLPSPKTNPNQPTPRSSLSSAKMFWDQSGPALATIQQYTYKYYIDAGTVGTDIQATCTDKSPAVVGLYSCTGTMNTLSNGTHNYTLEVNCSFCTPTSARSNPISYNNNGTSSVAAAASIMIESGNLSNIPPLTSIIDSYGAVWTQSNQAPASCPPSVVGHPASDCLTQYRNSVQIGLGSETYYKDNVIYVKGPSGSEMHWWKYNNSPSCPQGSTDTCWTDVGVSKP